MKHLIKFKIFEDISQEEMDRLLDKINKSGMNSLTWDEKQKLKSFTGEFKDTDNDVSFDKDGNLLIGGKSPLQSRTSSTDEPKKEPKQVNHSFNVKNNIDVFNEKLRHDNIIILKDNSKTTIGLDKYLQGVRRVYFIVFKEITDKKSRSSCIKLVYDMNKSGSGSKSKNWNFSIYDNYNNEMTFNQLTIFLSEHKIDYSTFNTAFYYIEEEYNNR